MIRSGTTPRALTWRGGLRVLGLGALLTLLPAWAQAQQPAPEKKTIELRLEGLRTELVGQAEGAKGQADAQKLEAELRKKMEEVRDLERRLKQTQERTKQPETPRFVPAPGDRATFWEVVPGNERERRTIVVRGELQNLVKPGTTSKGVLYELVPGEKGTLILRPVTPPTPAHVDGPVRIRVQGIERPGAPVIGVVTPTGRPEADGRAKDLEKRLDAIMRELEQLRKEIKAPSTGIRWELKPELKPAPRPGEQNQESRKSDELRRSSAELQQALEALKAAEEAVLARKALEGTPKKP